MASTRRIVGRVKQRIRPLRKLDPAETRYYLDWLKNPQNPRPDFVREFKPEERLSKIVTKRTRFGKRIQLQQIASVPQDSSEREALRKIEAEIQKRWKKEFGTKKIVSLLAKARVIQNSVSLRNVQGGRKPTVHQVLAVPLLRYGMDSNRLLEEVNSMATIRQHNPSQVRWEGAERLLYAAIHTRLGNGDSLLVGLEKKLFDSKRGFDSKQLAQELGIDWNHTNQSTINAALQLLETAGLIKKMPMARSLRPLSAWCHAAQKNPPVNYPNSSFEILRKLTTTYQSARNLYATQSTTMPKTPEKHVLKSSIIQGIQTLTEAGLVQWAIQKRQNQRGRSVPLRLVRITPLGQRLLHEHDQNNSLPEWGRKLLLGEKENGTS